MSYSITPNLGLKKPTPGADDDQWGTHWNENATILDTAFGSASAINVRSYGAKGDGVTNDAAAFASALAAAANGGEVFVPAGTYNIASALSQAITGGVSFTGAGSGATILSFSGNTDGLTFSLSPSSNIHIEGMTIMRSATTPVYGSTGLTITTPLTQAVRPGVSTINDVFVTGNVARTTGWGLGISVHNTSSLSMDHVYVSMPDGKGEFGIGIGIALSGLSATSYLVEIAFGDVSTLGGSIGLRLGDFIQGVYVANSRFIGNDYGIRWEGVAGGVDLLLAMFNSHVNSGTRGIQTIIASGIQIISSYVLHFPVPSTAGDWIGFEFNTMDSGLVFANNIYGNGASSSIPEYGIKLTGSNTTLVSGNHINNMKTAGIWLDTGSNGTITANNLGTDLATGIPLILDTSGASTNQKLGNMRNGVMTFAGPFVDAANDAAAALAGVPVDGIYRNGSAMMIRIV